MDALEAYDSIKLAELLAERLAAACAAVENKRVIKDEKAWLATARDLLLKDVEAGRSLIERTRLLPELLEVRQEFAATLQQTWVDALEKLLAGITFHAGSRAPIIETLFPHQKFQALRKANREAVTAYQSELQRRMKLSYSARILADEAYAFCTPCIESIDRAYAEWLTSFSNETLPEEQARPLREELVALGERLEVLIRQARLLAEAALVPVKDGMEELALNVKARKRTRGKREAQAVEEVPLAAAEVVVGEAPPAEEVSPEVAVAPVSPAEAPKKSRKKKAEPAPEANQPG